MPRVIRLILITAILATSLPAAPALADPPASNCEEGVQASGAYYLICMPGEGTWNGDVLIYAHGYTSPADPIQLPNVNLFDGMSAPEIANRLGFAFATTSYSVNGLAVLQGIADLTDLVHIFSRAHGQPRHVYLVGGSEGGIITALSVEQYPDVYSGGLAACGPVGDFRRQVNYWGNVRVLFDYFFPGEIPGSPTEVPQAVMDNWEAVYVPAITNALRADPHATDQLIRVAHIPAGGQDGDTVEATLLGLLWYNVFATNDGIEKLGGQPFDNSHSIYWGSDDDFKLNLDVQRFEADQEALDEIEAHYQTSGELSVPLVTLHNTGDPFVPYWHEPLYRWKAFWHRSSLRHSNIPSFRYGHCNFGLIEGVAAFGVLVLKVTGEDLIGVERVLPDAKSQQEFQRLLQEYGTEQMQK